MKIIITLLYFVFITLLVQVLVYNITLTNVTNTFYSIFWLFFVIYITFVTFILSKNIHQQSIFKRYLEIIKFSFLTSAIGILFAVMRDLILVNELNLVLYLKAFLSLLIVSLVISLIYFLDANFRKYRILWATSFVGTILFSPLLVESEMFIRDLRLKSFLDFWNLVVPYKSIEQLRQFVILEDWQGWELALISTIHLLIYCFIIISICLYIRQFQTKWQFEG
ncbi:MAG: hypothetical protein QW328_10010 [Nitrososphaerota archaeon]